MVAQSCSQLDALETLHICKEKQNNPIEWRPHHKHRCVIYLNINRDETKAVIMSW
jgi:hypothetical protein